MGKRTTALNERERYVLEQWPTKSYKKIAEELGVCWQRVGQIRHAAERKLREANRKIRNKERRLSMDFDRTEDV